VDGIPTRGKQQCVRSVPNSDAFPEIKEVDMRYSRIIPVSGVIALVALPALGQEGDGYFIVRDLSASPETAAAAIRAHVEAEEDWLFLAQFPLKGGDIQAMKICYLPIGADVFAAGLHVAAMMPCGNLAFYEEDGQGRLAMLDLAYLTALSDDPNIARAAETAAPAFDEMLDAALD
jgi:hypothetical protein